MKKTGIDLSFNWSLDRNGRNLSEQLCLHIRRAIQQGLLPINERIPASRVLAKELQVSRGIVTSSIEQLIAEGLLETRAGSGTYVLPAAEHLKDRRSQEAETKSTHPTPLIDVKPKVNYGRQGYIDFFPCRPSLNEFPLAVWKRCLVKASLQRPSPDYTCGQGDFELREAIADYLRRSRGLNTCSDRIIVTNGAVHAMHLLSRLYLNTCSEVVIEDPGYPLAKQMFELSGANALPYPVDEDGLQVANLPNENHSIRLVYVTPSHQFPTGCRLSLQRRHQLIHWARKNKVFIVEDDYDGEFRFDVLPLPPMAALSDNQVIYCGTFSKTMFPDLRVGFAVGPKEVIQQMAALRTITEYAGSSIVQKALGEFILAGHYERHIYRMRRIYSKKRDALAKKLESVNPRLKLTGLESGLHSVVQLGRSAAELAHAANRNKVLLSPVDDYCDRKSQHNIDYQSSSNESVLASSKNKVIFGYAEPSLEQIDVGIDRIAEYL